MPKSAITASALLGRNTAIGRLTLAVCLRIKAAQFLANRSICPKVNRRSRSITAVLSLYLSNGPFSKYSRTFICMMIYHLLVRRFRSETVSSRTDVQPEKPLRRGVQSIGYDDGIARTGHGTTQEYPRRRSEVIFVFELIGLTCDRRPSNGKLVAA